MNSYKPQYPVRRKQPAIFRPALGYRHNAEDHDLQDPMADIPGENYDLDDRSLGLPTLSRGLSVLQDRWKTGVFGFFLAFSPVVAHVIYSIPDYTAQGTVQVAAEESYQTNNGLKEFLGGANSNMETEVEIMKRREFLLEVAKSLHLHVQDPKQPKKYSDDLGITLKGATPVRGELYRMRHALESASLDPAYTGSFRLELRQNNLGQLEVKSPHAINYREWKVVDIEKPQYIGALSIKWSHLPVQGTKAVSFDILGNAAIVESILDRVNVTAVGSTRNPTNLVKVAFTDPDRNAAHDFVLAIMEGYVAQSLAWKTENAGRAADFIRTQVEAASEKLNNSESQLESYAKRQKAVQLSEQARLKIDEIGVLDVELRQVDTQIRLAKSVLNDLVFRSKAEGNLNLTSSFSSDPVLQASVQALTEAETQLKLKSATMTKDHPQVLKLRQQVGLRQAELEGQVNSLLRTLKTRKKSLMGKRGAARYRLSSFPSQKIELARHERGVATVERLHGFLLQKLQDAEILRASASTDKRIVDRPFIPSTPAHPKRVLILAVGVIFSGIFAVLLVAITQVLRKKIRSAREVQDRVPFPHYGSIPFDLQLRDHPEDNYCDPLTTESIRKLAVNVGMAHSDENRGQTVLVTSSTAQEGRSMVVSQLALAMAHTGARVLVMDLDLRNPSQQRLLDHNRAPGFTDWHAQGGGAHRLEAFIRTTQDGHLNVLTAGTSMADPTVTLDPRKLASTMAYLSTIYDHIIIDAPCVQLPDVKILSRVADLTLLVARPGVCRKKPIDEAVAAISRHPGSAGLVICGSTCAKDKPKTHREAESMADGGSQRL